ncbi:hypothetical protein HY485_00845 [Candidatus Woesearchaeota archaeon]|nr:hypothetical protein [Candidatus Woesearchaeota archaeon]
MQKETEQKYALLRTKLLERVAEEKHRKLKELHAFKEQYKQKIGADNTKIDERIHTLIDEKIQILEADKRHERLQQYNNKFEKLCSASDDTLSTHNSNRNIDFETYEFYETATPKVKALIKQRKATPTDLWPGRKVEIKYYLTIEQLAKLPGTYPISTLQNSILSDYKKKYQGNPDKETYFKLSEDPGNKRVYYGVREELLKAVLRNHDHAENIAEHVHEHIKLTEKETQTALERKITATSHDTVWVTIDELVKLPGAKTYAAIRTAFEKENIEKRLVRKPLNNKEVNLKSHPVTEAKLTPELLESIYAQKPEDYELLEACLKNEPAKEETKNIDAAITPQTCEEPAATSIDDVVEETKKPSKREVRAQEEYEISRKIMRKLIYGKKKVSNANTPLDNLQRNVPKEERHIAKRAIENMKRYGWLNCQHVSTGFTKTSVFSEKLPEINSYFSFTDEEKHQS